MSDLEAIIFLSLILAVMLTGILFVAFGQVTVRKLRKNPATRDALGFEHIGGADIATAAFSLLVPKSLWFRYRQRREEGWPAPDPGLLRQHMSKLDQILGKTLASIWLATMLAFFVYACAESAGAFN
jgi:hypothetical protein